LGGFIFTLGPWIVKRPVHSQSFTFFEAVAYIENTPLYFNYHWGAYRNKNSGGFAKDIMPWFKAGLEIKTDSEFNFEEEVLMDTFITGAGDIDLNFGNLQFQPVQSRWAAKFKEMIL
jgi:hypothetical protein